MIILDTKKAEAVIDSLSKLEIEYIIKKFKIGHLVFGNDAEALKDFLNEDYAFVLPVLKYLLKKVNISKIEVVDYCDECEDDAVLKFDLNTGKRTCTVCGSECEKYEI